MGGSLLWEMAYPIPESLGFFAQSHCLELGMVWQDSVHVESQMSVTAVSVCIILRK